MKEAGRLLQEAISRGVLASWGQTIPGVFGILARGLGIHMHTKPGHFNLVLILYLLNQQMLIEQLP